MTRQEIQEKYGIRILLSPKQANEQLSDENAKDYEDFIKSIVSSLEMKTIQSEWKISSDGYYPYCDNCKCEPPSGEMTNFCPDCGAKMKRKDKMTNFARIKRMSIDEMAELIADMNITCTRCPASGICLANPDLDCEDIVKQWLESEVEE